MPDLKDGVARRIIWAGKTGERTDFSVVYLHGFSATSEEIRPVPDRVALALGANLYFSRLSGHGRDGTALAEPRAGDWLNDTAEALEIGRRIGERTIVISTSTGSTLAALLATGDTPSDTVAAHVMVSPNFGLNSPYTHILNLPWVRHWGPLVAGRERGFKPSNERHKYFWTFRHPTTAVVPVAALVKEANRRNFANAAVPALFLLADEDTVVRADMARKVAKKWGGGGTVQAVRLGPDDDSSRHILAGDILSPGQTDATVSTILDWLSENL